MWLSGSRGGVREWIPKWGLQTGRASEEILANSATTDRAIMSATLFLIVGFGSLVFAYWYEGGNLVGLLVLTAAIIVFGGTFGALGLSYPYSELKRLPGILRVAFGGARPEMIGQVLRFVDQASIARREGVLALERMIEDDPDTDELTQVGMRLVVDGVEPEVVREIMEAHVETVSERHAAGAEMLDAAGGFAPTMGIIGTVMGLVHVLGSLADPGNLGPSIAVAFIATLYGVASANLLWLPLANKLKSLDRLERNDLTLEVEGVMLIAKGSNPRIVEEKLRMFLNPDDKDVFRDLSGERHGKAETREEAAR
jgi:chemotaxis protein MotA